MEKTGSSRLARCPWKIADEVAAVVEILPVHAVVLGGDPARGLHIPDGLERPQLSAEAGMMAGAAAGRAPNITFSASFFNR